jgi:intracellular multiplication protein IcmL
MSNKPWLSAIFVLILAQTALISCAYLQYATRAPVHFFAKPTTQEVFKLTALERPNVSAAALLSWATLAATATFTFDFVNYNESLNELRDYFTVMGYENFVTSLEEAGTLSTIDAKKLVLTCVAIGSAIITGENEKAGIHSWNIQIPVLVRYQSADTNETRLKLVSLLVTQVPTKDAPKGIGISQYVATDIGPEYAG